MAYYTAMMYQSFDIQDAIDNWLLYIFMLVDDISQSHNKLQKLSLFDTFKKKHSI